MRERVVMVKLLAGVMFREGDRCDLALSYLTRSFSRVDYRSPLHPFDVTDYYEEEMGRDLMKLLISFEDLEDPTILVRARHESKEIEEKLCREGKRSVNIDMGYMDLNKVVLASFKGRGNKIYLGDNVWADMTMIYERGSFTPFPWSFPDFKSLVYNRDLLHIRQIYREQVRGLD